MAYMKSSEKKKHGLEVDSKLPTIGGSPELLSPNKAAKENVELFYEGSKFYWRSRINVDFHFYLHGRFDTMEIIPFNVEKQEEMERLFINFTSLSKKTEDLFNEKLELVRADISKDRFKKLPPEAELRKNVLKKTITDFLLLTLGVDSDNEKNVPMVSLVPSTVDTEQVEASHTPPTGFPVIVVRRRRKTAPGDFVRAMSDFQNDSFSVAEACLKAQELTVLSSNVIGKFQKAIESGSFNFGKGMSRDDLGISIKVKESVPRRRWKWAIRRVIRQNEVAKVSEQLKKREMRMSFPIDSSSNSTSMPKLGAFNSFDSPLNPSTKHGPSKSSPKLDPIPDLPHPHIENGSSVVVPVKGIASGRAYARSVSMQDPPNKSRTIAYGDVRASRDKRPSRDTSPVTVMESKPGLIVRRGSKGAIKGSDSEGEAAEPSTSTKKKRSVKRDWAPKPVAELIESPSEDVAKAKPKRRARATNVDEMPPPSRSLAPLSNSHLPDI